MKRLFLLLLLATIPALAQTNWHHPLYLDGGGYWNLRAKVTFSSAAELKGTPQVLAVGDKLPMAGAEARGVRVINANGKELLFNIMSADGAPRHEGKIQNGDQLTIPLDSAAHQNAALWIYWGNDKAGLVPDFLPGAFANGYAESGNNAPFGWRSDGNDEAHILRWENVGHSGQKALYAEAKAGAAQSWFKWGQSGIPVAPGQQIEISAWVKGENVVGNAGWYVHVNGSKPQLINNVIKAGDGTFDWKEVKFSFTVPETGATMDIGTVLYGTGKAWFDDVSLKITGNENGAAKIEIGPVEKMELTPNNPKKGARFGGSFMTWPKPPGYLEIPLTVYNFANAAKRNALISADVRRELLLAHIPPKFHFSLEVFDYEKFNIVPVRLDDGIVSFEADLPPHSISKFTFRPYGVGEPPLSPDERFAAPNLVQNASFESGGELPDNWDLSAQKEDGKPIGSAKRVRGGKEGDWAVELTIPTDAKANWSGWHQFVPVTEGKKYRIGAWIKTKDSGGVQLNAHWRDGYKKLVAQNPYTGAGPMLNGTSDWKWLENTVIAPPDSKWLELHLTTNTTGTIWHDGILVRELKETLTASVGPLRASFIPNVVPTAGFRIWQASPALKIFKDDAIQADVKTAAISLARNEREPLQLVLRNPQAREVKVNVAPLKNAAGAVLPVEIARVGYVPVDYATNYYRLDAAKAWERKIPTEAPASDGWAGDWPDPLYPLKNGDAVSLRAGEAQPLYFTVHAPESAAPGLYKGEISIGERKIPLSVRVRDFTLPKTPSLQIIFDCRGSKAPSAESWWRFMAEHRISPGIIPEPKFTLENGVVKADFSEFDKAATFCFDELGMSAMYTPESFYALGWAYSPKDFLGTKAFTPEWENAFGSALRQYYDHVKAKGWLDKITFYLSDEPFDKPEVADNLQKFSRFVQKNMPGVPVYASTWTHMKALEGAVTRWGAGHVGMFPVADIKERQAAGDSFWFTTDGQQCLDTPYLGTERLLSWACFQHGVGGFEFWGVNWWTYDPHKFGWHAYISQADSEKTANFWVRYPNGDGYLAYPGKDGPISSIRLEAVRDGAEDYEYLQILQERMAKSKAEEAKIHPPNEVFNGPASPRQMAIIKAESLLQQAKNQAPIPDAGGRYSSKNQSDPTALLKLRDQIGDAIEELK